MKFTTQEGMDIMPKLTNDQKALVEHAQSLEGLNVRIEEETSPTGAFEYVTVTVDYDAEWYDIGQSVVLMSMRFKGERARQKARRVTWGITFHNNKELKIRQVRSAIDTLWLFHTKAGKEEQARMEERYGR